ncbi:MAG TPA: shikimate dehydrogenase [Bacteroidota bacterium]|nr:shikimate dehydrogenase [Bacteroidota bacterium]
MKQFAIIGHPVAHSLSPLMHNTAFEALGMDCRYEAIDVEPDDLGDAISGLRTKSFTGFNVTLPHKQEVMKVIDEVEPEAKAIGAVNTVVRTNDRLVGLNTDLLGFLESLSPFKTRIEGASVLVLGAGGGARAALYGLLGHHKPARILVLNRSLEKAEEIAAAFGDVRPETKLSAESLFVDSLQKTVDAADIIINTTSVGMKPYSDASPLEDTEFKKTQLIMDFIYVPIETKLIKSALKSGATALSGLEMLLRQGAAAFQRWTGQEMPLDIVRSAVVQNLKGQ